MKEIRTTSNPLLERQKSIKEVNLFAHLSDEQLSILSNHSTITHYKKGEQLFVENEPITSILLVHKGRIKTCHYDNEGSECILNIYHDHEVIYESLYFNQTRFPYYSFCLTDVTIVEIERTIFLDTVKDNLQFLHDMIHLLSEAVYTANEKNVLLTIKDPMARLASFLLDKDEHCVGPEISLKLDDIAASIGLRSETISRYLSKLEKEGYIKRVGNGKILVTDRTGLKETISF